MKNLMLIAICAAGLVPFLTSTSRAQTFDRTFGQDDTMCISLTGTEIKQEYDFAAPAGYFFADVDITEQKNVVSFAGGDIGCLEWAIHQEPMPKQMR